MYRIIPFMLILLGSTHATGQHETHHHPQDTSHHEETGHQTDQQMAHAFSRNLPMNRNGSGTGWLPDNSPMYGYMFHSSRWMFMLHGNIFVRYNTQDPFDRGTRGDEKFDVPNWFMFMGQRETGRRGLFRFSSMLSLDPLTVGGEGYPLLFQSGETWLGEPLVDRQHPHDLFSELSVAYTYMISSNTDLFLYAGYPGEPAFGPVAFMHRVSGLFNPDAPISHHWQDATHITFGVVTAGVRHRNFKLEGSSFTGREPDEERFGFDKPRFDSWSGRLSWNPLPSLALQVSQARVNDVHEFGPREDVSKTTASVIHAIRPGHEKYLNSAIVWGYNQELTGHHDPSHSFLAESAFTLRRFSVYGKYEWVEKSAEDLLLDERVFPHGELYNINALTLGIQQKLLTAFKTNLAIGVQGTLYAADTDLENLYGKYPVGLQVYLRFYPDLMVMTHQQ